MPEITAAAGRCSLDESPATNWIERNGGLPDFICRIAVHLQDTMDTSHAIATAINAVKKMCTTGDLNFPGMQNVNAGSRAEACKAVQEWEALKARAHAHRVGAAASPPADLYRLIAITEGTNPAMLAFSRTLAHAGVPDAAGNTLTAAAAVRPAGLPLPIHQIDRHGNVRLVGRVLSLSYTDGVLACAGELFDPTVDETALAVDYADATVTVTAEGSARITSMLVAGLTCKALTATVTGNTGLPIAEPADRPWDGDAAAAHMLAAATGADGKVDPAKLAQGFLWRDDSADPATLAAYKLPFADVISGSLQIVPAGVSAALGAMSGARGGVKGLSDADRSAIQGKLDALDKRIRSVTAAGAAVLDAAPAPAAPGNRFADIARPLNPPRKFFTDPKLPGPTPPTITADGEFFGHMADWQSCHRSFVAAGLCLTPPHSHCDYCEFKTSTVLTAEGDTLRVGAFSFGGGHADLSAGKAEATAHYADVGSVVVLAMAGEDEHGIWLHGSVTPTATDEQLYGLLAYPPSGDWREPRPGAPLEMIAVCSVAHPGYNVQAHVAAGVPVALVIPYGGHYDAASGTADADTPENMAASSAIVTPTITPELAALRAQAVDAIAASIGRDRTTQLAELDLLVHPS